MEFHQFQWNSIVRILKLHPHRLLVSSWLSVPGGEELVAAVDPRRRGVGVVIKLGEMNRKNRLWLF